MPLNPGAAPGHGRGGERRWCALKAPGSRDRLARMRGPGSGERPRRTCEFYGASYLHSNSLVVDTHAALIPGGFSPILLQRKDLELASGHHTAGRRREPLGVVALVPRIPGFGVRTELMYPSMVMEMQS